MAKSVTISEDKKFNADEISAYLSLRPEGHFFVKRKYKLLSFTEKEWLKKLKEDKILKS